MTFKKVHRGYTQPDVYLQERKHPETPTIRISHDPAFRPDHGVVEFDLARIDAVVMALINLKAELTEHGE